MTSRSSTRAPLAKIPARSTPTGSRCSGLRFVRARTMASVAPATMTISAMSAISNGSNYSEYYRQFYLDDRNRTQARFQIDVDVLRNLTVTPTVKWSDDEFLLTQNQLGLTHDRSLGAGVEASYVANSDLRFLFSYMNENRSQFTWSSNTQLFPYSTSNP